MTDYVTVNHGILSAFVDRWHTETSSFHLPHGEISITLYDASCLLHLPIMGEFLDNNNINRDGVLEMMVDYLGVDLENFMKELEAT